jgi:catecholate siderophore receptor
VEVAKGPSSVTTGRGSTGGSINLVTKSASLRNAADVRVTGGNASYQRATMDVNRRLSESVALRLNGMWQDAGMPGRDEVAQKGWGFAPSVGIGLGRPTTLTVGYQRLQQNNIPDYGLPGTLPDAAVAAGQTVDDLDFSNFYGLVSRDHEKVTSDVLTATVGHSFRGARHLRNLTRYGRNYLDRVVTSPRAATAANAASDPGFNPRAAQIRRTDTKYQYRDDRVLTNVTDFTASFATGSIRHDAVAGVELAKDRQPSYTATDAFTNGRPPVTDLFHPDAAQPYAPAIIRTGATAQARAQSTALYAFDTVKLHDRVQADLGLRWDRIDVDYTTTSALGARSDFGRVDSAASGRTGIVYKPVQRASVYASYSTSFNPSFDGAFGLTLAATGVNSAALPPERSRNVELGAKWDLRTGLFATVAAFRTEKTNAKTTDAATGATVLAGNQQVSGVEFGVAGSVTSRWNVFSGLSLMDGTINESAASAEVDRRLSYVPDVSFNVWSTYRLPFDLTLGGGAQFTGGYFFNNTNALTSANAAAIQRLTRYWLFNAVAVYDVNSHLSLQINGTNLADTRYVDRGYTGHFIPGPGARAPDQPRAEVLTGCFCRFPTFCRRSRSHTPRRRLDASEWVDGRVTAGASIRAGQGQRATSARSPGRSRNRRSDPVGARTERPVRIRGTAAAGLSAVVQPIQRRAVIRQPRRQRDAPARRYSAAHPRGSFGDVVSCRPR